jgi:hypothetical protein
VFGIRRKKEREEMKTRRRARETRERERERDREGIPTEVVRERGDGTRSGLQIFYLPT